MSESATGPVYSEKSYTPNVMIISDDAHAANEARQAVSASGARLVAEIGFEGATQRIAEQIRLDAVLIECANTSPDGVIPLLSSIQNCAARRMPHAVISPAIADLDHYGAFLGEDEVTLICAGDTTDRLVALQLAFADSPNVIRDSATDLESARLRRIADEVGRIAKALASMSEPQPVSTPFGVGDVMVGFRAEPSLPLTQDAELPNAAELRATIRLRRLREQHFPADMFADPAWDMLLDLLAAKIESVQVAVSSLCIASAVPPTTALRWIKRMCDDGLFERVSDPEDGRRIFIRLTDQAVEALSRYWQAAKKIRSNSPLQ